jgi:uncharacterized surface protein with fasciclin (FAS1) repeats
MKKIFVSPMAIVAMASVTFFSCASSEKMETTAMEESTTISETETMAGDTDMDVNTDRSVTTASDMDYDNMFEDVGNTQQYNVVALAKTNPNLSTFVTLVQSAGLADVLQGEGPFTVFAPTNQAFNKLSQEKLNMLMKPENKAELIKVLQLHVLPSKVSSTQFKDNQRIEAADNKYIQINVDQTAPDVMIGGANIVKPNVEASNGIIHIVDGVITTTSAAAPKY